MYQGSEDVVYEMPSGYTEENLVCNPDNSSYLTLGSSRSILEALDYVYDIAPCQNIEIICNVFNAVGRCNMEYFAFDQSEWIDSVSYGYPLNASYFADVYDWIDIFSCFNPIPESSLVETRCIGTCPLSPTYAPTIAPSSTPTAPSINPTSAPTQPPTVPPTNAPSIAPSTAPTGSPSLTPSNDPTNSPTPSPSAAPTRFPTFSPTPAPSESPIANPTVSPSTAPTYSPSQAPTNNPIISKDFHHFISVTYLLENVNDFVKTSITTNPVNETRSIEWIIKSKYFKEDIISYKNFIVSIGDIEGVAIPNIGVNSYTAWDNLNSLHLNGQIECNMDDENVNYCASIQQQSKKNNDFDDRVTAVLQLRYDNPDLIFTVANGDSLEIDCKDCEEEAFDYVLYGLATIVGIIYLIALCALLFNMGKFPKLPGFHYVDNGNWVALMTIGLQFWFVYIHSL